MESSWSVSIPFLRWRKKTRSEREGATSYLHGKNPWGTVVRSIAGRLSSRCVDLEGDRSILRQQAWYYEKTVNGLNTLQTNKITRMVVPAA